MWNRAQAPDSKGSLKSRTMTPVTTADRFYVVSQSVNRLNCRQTCNLSRLRRALCRNHGPLRSIPVWPAIRFPWHLLYHVFYFSLSHKHTGPHTHRVTHTHTWSHTQGHTHTEGHTQGLTHPHMVTHTHTPTKYAVGTYGQFVCLALSSVVMLSPSGRPFPALLTTKLCHLYSLSPLSIISHGNYRVLAMNQQSKP